MLLSEKKLLTRSDPLIIMYSWLLHNFLGTIEINFYSVLLGCHFGYFLFLCILCLPAVSRLLLK